jgi:hypothetical protein
MQGYEKRGCLHGIRETLASAGSCSDLVLCSVQNLALLDSAIQQAGTAIEIDNIFVMLLMAFVIIITSTLSHKGATFEHPRYL